MSEDDAPLKIVQLTAGEIVESYQLGKRDFSNLEFSNYLEFSNCNLDDIDFRKTYLDGTFKNVSLRNANFSFACIKSCIFRDCDLTFANFKESGIDAIEFSNCKLAHACFDNASGCIPIGELPSWIGARDK